MLTQGNMLMISREQVGSLVGRIGQGADASCLEEVKRMLEIKSTLLWRADAACGCVGTGPAHALYMEIQMLEDILGALEAGDIVRGVSLLEQYATVIG